MNEVWHLEDALKLVRVLQPEAKTCGYHVAVGGSVLNVGYSYKDLDLYFLPFENPGVNHGYTGLLEMVSVLQDLWGPYKDISGKEYGKHEALSPREEVDNDKGGWKVVPGDIRFEGLLPRGDYNGGAPGGQAGPTSYKLKLKFTRTDSRIDCFFL